MRERAPGGPEDGRGPAPGGDGEPREGAPPAAEHRTAVVESGSFAYARCTCGWRAPARRARSAARGDAEAHTTPPPAN